MVLAFETPIHTDGENGFIIEDLFLITVGRAVPAWSLDRVLVELGN